MRDLGQLWESCHNGDIPRGEWEYQYKLIISGVPYYDENILSVTHDKGLMGNNISIGEVISGKLNATVLPNTNHEVSKGDEVRLQLRVDTLNNGQSEWFNFGVYYLHSAERENERWRIEAYDKLLETDEQIYGEGVSAYATASGLLGIIIDKIGAQLDLRNEYILMDTPFRDYNEYTMRELLGFIASLNLSNWCITEEGKLRLVKPVLRTPVQASNSSNSKRLIDKTPLKFDKVLVKYGNSVDEVQMAGTGENKLELFNPFADNNMAHRVYSLFTNYTFMPGDITSTEINPAVELGDTIEINGNLVNLVNMSYSSRMYADIQIPDQVGRIKNNFSFESGGGKDYDDDIEDLGNRLDVIEELLGSNKCELVTGNKLIGNEFTPEIRYNDRDYCAIILSDIKRAEFMTYSRIEQGSRFKVSGGSGLNNCQDMFSHIESKEGSNPVELDVSDLRTDNVTNMNGMFRFSQTSERSNVKIVGLSNLLTSSLNSIDEIFRGSLEDSMEGIQSWKLNKISSAKGSFMNYKGTNFKLDNLSSLRFAQSMFSGSSLESLTIGNISSNVIKGLSSTYKMFSTFGVEDGSSKLSIKSINMGEADMESMFENSRINGEFMDIFENKDLNMKNVKTLRSSFKNSKFDSIDLSDQYVETGTFVEVARGSSNLKTFKFPKVMRTSLTSSINPLSINNAFVNCENIESIILPSEFTNSGVYLEEGSSSAFLNCPKLKFLNLSGFTPEFFEINLPSLKGPDITIVVPEGLSESVLDSINNDPRNLGTTYIRG